MTKKDGFIYFDKEAQYIIKAILVFSAPFLTILLSNRYEIEDIFVGTLLSFLIFLALVVEIFKIERINIKQFVITLFFSLYIIKNILGFASNNLLLMQERFQVLFGLNLGTEALKDILGFLAIPCATFFVYMCICKIKVCVQNFVNNLTKIEKGYIFVMFAFASILTVLVVSSTTAFSKPIINGECQVYDVIYTSDTGSIVSQDAYFDVSHPENDIRQPLFGIFSLPFAVVAKILSDLFFFLPKNFGYEMFMTIIQFMLTTISTIMLGKILKLTEKEKLYLYLLFSFSFPYIVFNLVLEQYVIGLFYLILAIYIYYQSNKETNYMYIGAVGTLVTSGIIFPLITKTKEVKKWTTNVMKCFAVFISIAVIGGQYPQFVTLIERFSSLTNSWAGNVTFWDKVYRFTDFAKGIFFANSGQILLEPKPSYQLIPANAISIIGVIILLIMVASFILNRKEKMAKISFLWVVFSFVILFVIGWGMPENGLVLYSLYFAWAYLILYFLFLKNICKDEKLFAFLVLASVLVMAICNIQEFLNIFSFGMQYY